jgi:predicted RND superfamily exporter protein
VKEKRILLLTVLLTGVLVNSAGLVFAQTNSTSTAETPEETDNLGQYVSAYVHEHIALVKQQRAETIDAINDCRKELRNADNEEDRTDVQESCKATLKEIREKYKAQREEYRQLFKEYRDSMKILIKEAKGQAVSAEQKEKAMKDIGEIKETQEKMKEERQAMQEQMKEERQAKDKKEK